MRIIAAEPRSTSVQFYFPLSICVRRCCINNNNNKDHIAIKTIFNQFSIQDPLQEQVAASQSLNVTHINKVSKAHQISQVVCSSILPKWFYIDDNQTWAEYSHIVNSEYGSLNSLDSQSLEKHFSTNDHCFTAKLGNFIYEIDLNDMTQTNSQTRKIRNIWRKITQSPTIYGWFFRNSDGSWNQMKEIHSQAVEKHFSLTPGIIFSSKKFSINFEKMIMTRHHPKEDRLVRRVELCIVRDQQPQFLWQELHRDGNWNAIVRGKEYMHWY